MGKREVTLEALIAAQEAWAGRMWPGHAGRRAPSLAANLIVPMTSDVERQFKRGSGGELGSAESPGKMFSVRSSSALSYNVFAPWINHDLTPVARALDVDLTDQTLVFEGQFPHGLASAPPNIDVVLDNKQPRPLGIECKFTEPYGNKKPHPVLDEKYFDGDRLRWTECGLPHCQQLARNIGRGVEFRRLGAGQLLKHLLGLAWTTKEAPRLMYLWYDTGCDEASEHRKEIAIFEAALDSSVEFQARTYQQVFSSLQTDSEPIKGYRAYLTDRYFDG